MDGRRVLKKGGPSWFGYRRKRDDTELWASNEGLEVKKGGTVCWGIQLDR